MDLRLIISLLTCLFTYGYSLIHFSQYSGWTYKPGPKGPQSWASKWPMCGDNFLWQSPINIPLETTPAGIDQIQLTNLDSPQVNVTLQNAWRSAQVYLDPQHKISIWGGSLPRGIRYYLSTISMNVGSTNANGSSHLVRGKAYPAEIVLAFTDLPEANETNTFLANSVAVISFLVDISPEDNPGWDSMIRSFPKIKRAGSWTNLDISSLRALLPQYQDWTTRYYAYVGSSQLPPCREHALRVLYSTPINLSSRQINAIRQICDEDGDRIVDNSRRPLRPLNHNQVLRSFLQ